MGLCVSWEWNTVTEGVAAHLDRYERTYRRTGVRPLSISVNPGIHQLVPGYKLDALITATEALRARCRSLFAAASSPAADSSAPSADSDGWGGCILHTTAFTAYNQTDADAYGHRRLYSDIRGYNAAAAAAWHGEGSPVIDGGALSLAPAISNAIHRDKLHFEPLSPYHHLTWQMVLNTALGGGAPVCEREA